MFLGSRPQLERGPWLQWSLLEEKNEVVCDLVLWEPKHGKRSVGGQAGTFLDLLEADTRVPRDSLPATMDGRVSCRKRAMGSPEADLVVVVVVVCCLLHTPPFHLFKLQIQLTPCCHTQ